MIMTEQELGQDPEQESLPEPTRESALLALDALRLSIGQWQEIVDEFKKSSENRNERARVEHERTAIKDIAYAHVLINGVPYNSPEQYKEGAQTSCVLCGLYNNKDIGDKYCTMCPLYEVSGGVEFACINAEQFSYGDYVDNCLSYEKDFDDIWGVAASFLQELIATLSYFENKFIQEWKT